jgi:hypothetical protein
VTTAICLYSLSIIAGIALVLYGFFIQPRKREQPASAHGDDVSPDTTIPIDEGLTLLPEEDSSNKHEA